jgi:translation initiation factor IF-3
VFSIAGRDYRINQQIRVREVRLIGDAGEQLGVVSTAEAIQMARDQGVDLVEVSPNASPPVCRLLDYGRFRYTQTKRDREARKSQKTNVVREVRFRPRIAEHDRISKIRRIQELLGEGAKVKVSVMFRGREITHPELGVTLLRGVAEQLKEEAKLETPPLMEGRRLNIILAPMATVPVKPAAKAPEEEETPVGDQATEEVQA